MLKVGVVGIGHMGRYHVNVLLQLTNVKLSAICDIDKDLVAEQSKALGIKGFTDYNKFLSNVDAVVIAVPTHLHFAFASEAILRKKHVLVEKPITQKLEEAEKLINMAEKNGVFLQVGHVERFNAAVQELQNIVKHPYLIQSLRLGPKSRVKDVGVVMDLMIHDIDIILSIAKSQPVDITAHGQRIFSEYEDVANASIYFANGVIANLTASRVTDNKIRTLAISQQGAYISLDYATQEIHIFRQPQTEYLVMKEEIKYTQEALVERVFVHKENALKLEHEHFIECISNGREPIYKSEADISALRIATIITDKIHQSWQNK